MTQREAKREAVREKAICILLKIEKQMEVHEREGEGGKTAELTKREKSFLMRNDLVHESIFECSAIILFLTIKTSLKYF